MGKLRFKSAIALSSKGNLVNIPESGDGCCGNANELGDVSGSPGKSFLFFLTVYTLRKQINWRLSTTAGRAAHFVLSGALPTALENPRERIISSLVVLITAAGLQGE